MKKLRNIIVRPLPLTRLKIFDVYSSNIGEKLLNSGTIIWLSSEEGIIGGGTNNLCVLKMLSIWDLGCEMLQGVSLITITLNFILPPHLAGASTPNQLESLESHLSSIRRHHHNVSSRSALAQ